MANANSPQAASTYSPKRVHAGANIVRARYVCAASHSATDVIQMVKIPNGAIVDEVVLFHSGDVGSDAGVVNVTVGDADDPNRYASFSAALATVQRATTGLGHQVSLSDDASVMYQTIDITFVSGGPITASHVVEMYVIYHVDQ